jgi:hypothetical protein
LLLMRSNYSSVDDKTAFDSKSKKNNHGRPTS